MYFVKNGAKNNFKLNCNNVFLEIFCWFSLNRERYSNEHDSLFEF